MPWTWHLTVIPPAGIFRDSGELQEISGRTCGPSCMWSLRVMMLLCSTSVRNDNAYWMFSRGTFCKQPTIIHSQWQLSFVRANQEQRSVSQMIASWKTCFVSIQTLYWCLTLRRLGFVHPYRSLTVSLEELFTVELWNVFNVLLMRLPAWFLSP